LADFVRGKKIENKTGPIWIRHQKFAVRFLRRNSSSPENDSASRAIDEKRIFWRSTTGDRVSEIYDTPKSKNEFVGVSIVDLSTGISGVL
jgi:hypothetical protein